MERTLLFLLGETNEPLDRYAAVVVWCPIRHALLIQQGAACARFGDFAPGTERGIALDAALRTRVEDGLGNAAVAHADLRWAPLALQQVLWPLARHCWVKECARAMLRTYRPARCVLSSGDDEDIVLAVRAVAAEEHIAVEVRDGPYDGTSSSLRKEVPYGIPLRLDPAWFHALHWRVVAALHRTRVLIESYPNIRRATFPDGWLRMSVPRAVAFLTLVRMRLRVACGRPGKWITVQGELSTHAELPRDPAVLWPTWPPDERAIAAQALAQFASTYAPAHLDAAAARCAAMLAACRPQRIVLAVDQLDADRLLAMAAHARGVAVDYLPHGNIYEDQSGRARHASWDADRVLAWNAASCNTFRRLGWDAVAVRHPTTQVIPVPRARLPENRATWTVLLLLPEWLYVSLGGREDCAMAWLVDAYNGLTALGVAGVRIHVKYHETAGVRIAEDAKAVHVRRARELLGMEFQVLDSALRVAEVMQSYDLVVTGPTTGIFEAVLRGVPVVLFGDGFERIGALDGASLPHARTARDLPVALAAHDGDAMDAPYTQLAHAFQSGLSFADVA